MRICILFLLVGTTFAGGNNWDWQWWKSPSTPDCECDIICPPPCVNGTDAVYPCPPCDLEAGESGPPCDGSRECDPEHCCCVPTDDPPCPNECEPLQDPCPHCVPPQTGAPCIANEFGNSSLSNSPCSGDDCCCEPFEPECEGCQGKAGPCCEVCPPEAPGDGPLICGYNSFCADIESCCCHCRENYYNDRGDDCPGCKHEYEGPPCSGGGSCNHAGTIDSCCCWVG